MLLDNFKQHLQNKIGEKQQKFALMRALRQPNKAKASAFLNTFATRNTSKQQVATDGLQFAETDEFL